MISRIERILILCKTYPSPSARHAETSCVAGMLESGKIVRLYPVPFRLISDDKQFRKWQWITARITPANDDRRKESHRIFVDTIEAVEEPLPTSQGWRLRRDFLSRLPTFQDFEAMEVARQREGVTLAVLRPSQILGLEIKAAANPDWTPEEKAKLVQMQLQGTLFSDAEVKAEIRTLKKLPFDFYYRYQCESDGVRKDYRHKVVDWEAGALFWNVSRAHGLRKWEAPFRNKLEVELPKKDLMFLMGTIHRFPDQWLIVSLLYPPKQPFDERLQGQLFPQ